MKETEHIRYTAYRNAGAPHAADPWIIRDKNDYYYCFSARGGICVARCASLSELRTAAANAALVWTPPANTPFSREIWAPELHRIGGRWYIYFAADDGRNEHHRMYVLSGTDDADPTKPFTFVSRISDASDKWAIDGTVFTYRGELYFVWSGWEGDENIAQNLYIAHMRDPWTIDGARVLLSAPQYSWETNSNPRVNEGPAVLVGEDSVYIVYSASGSWLDTYCLGQLVFHGGDILDPGAWEKSSEPVFTQTAGTHGPGHCSFAEAPDGTWWMFYHANETPGSGWRGRSFRMQPVMWDGRSLSLGHAARPDEAVQVPVQIS